MVEHDEASSLLEHIQRDGGTGRAEAEGPLRHAVEDRGSADVRWSDEGKQAAIAAIDAWVAAEGIPETPEIVQQLRLELMRDLGSKPTGSR